MASLPLRKVLTLHYTSDTPPSREREGGFLSVSLLRSSQPPLMLLVSMALPILVELSAEGVGSGEAPDAHCFRTKVLEKASGEGFGKTAAIIQLAPKAPVDLCETEKLRAAFFAVPLEMRGSFLVLLLRECFRDLSWLALIHSVRGEAGLLVTSIVPKTPFFWAMHVTEALHQNMQALFSTLAQAEEQQPYLEGSTVMRGTRCLAEYHLGDYGHAWNRCWVLDRVDTWAVVMFIDFGQLATIPVQSLRSLDSDDFWTIPPLTQPFMLEKDILSSYEVVHRILKGKITGALNSAVTAPASNLAVVPPLLPLGCLQQAAA
ncbi:tudor domain-containing protein 10 isoform X7 [Homo sapiens]|uniref:tudor domain-containing protein 10 isoform X7 n=1 Tax=Homo sapiens TaxID=9606 RepID=UPI0005D01B2F|nr:tudor domain-containing protein 10 isoform X7 [Homo sapiens]|eukprot:XP_011507461.1 tudor domain-containing protein 10 isoform X7 [Homo sapiens]